ncbi:MAG: hypothetical protein IPJ19_02350 [Planctomycetes bacterium]|nr:hypothetical protein [Planctomycetota bacterium]
MRPTTGNDSAVEAWNKSWGEAVRRWESSHLSWTAEELRSRYGDPDSIHADSEGPSYVYEGKQLDGRPASFIFQTRAGYVYDVDIAAVLSVK